MVELVHLKNMILKLNHETPRFGVNKKNKFETTWNRKMFQGVTTRCSTSDTSYLPNLFPSRRSSPATRGTRAGRDILLITWCPMRSSGIHLFKRMEKTHGTWKIPQKWKRRNVYKPNCFEKKGQKVVHYEKKTCFSEMFGLHLSMVM